MTPEEFLKDLKEKRGEEYDNITLPQLMEVYYKAKVEAISDSELSEKIGQLPILKQ